MMNNSESIKTVWITGASSGIGRALAKCYLAQGWNVVASARRLDKLQELEPESNSAKNQFMALALDMTDSAALERATQKVSQEFKKIDMIILNAGISQRSLVIETEMKVYQQIFDLNVMSNIRLTKLMLPLMREQKNGQIVVISSVVGKISTPLRSGYAATKHALHGFYESLAMEEYANNIRVNIVVPGYVNTEVSLNALTKDGSKHNQLDDGQKSGMSAQLFAQKLIKRLDKRDRVEIVIAGFYERFGLYLYKKFPGLYFRIIRNAKVT